MRIPLAWLQISRTKIRLVVALAGITFADILMFMQIGFRSALYKSATLIHEHLITDLVLISPQAEAMHRMKSFSRRLLYQSLYLKEVDSISSVYINLGDWKNPQTDLIRTIMVIGFNPEQPIMDFPEVNQNLDKIKQQDVLLFDTASRPEFGPIKQEFVENKTLRTELNRRQVEVAGLFSMGTSFAYDGTVITSDLNLLRIFPNREPGRIEIGLIRLRDNSDPTAVKNKLQTKLGKHVKVLTNEEFAEFEKNYWATKTPIGFIFTLGTGMGFLVGTIIVYQILYSDVSDHLPEYATLKAMGYTDRYLLTVVFQEAIILAVLGFIPGFSISLGLYSLTQTATKLPMIMTITRVFTVLISTIIMCSFSGAIAVQRLRDADPADIF